MPGQSVDSRRAAVRAALRLRPGIEVNELVPALAALGFDASAEDIRTDLTALGLRLPGAPEPARHPARIVALAFALLVVAALGGALRNGSGATDAPDPYTPGSAVITVTTTTAPR